ncbi:hypothetical protein [Rasiella sp. SM2506]|uniref:hypothetical protein n=1 Tax=Rasiella sp. SM2506 TaxID=3423914 RepID=UPI003D7A6CD4
MAASDILDTIENTYEVEDITLLNGRRVWPLLRQKIIFETIRESLGYDNKLRTRNKKQLGINFFSGIKQLFRLKKFDFIFFNNTDKRVLLDGTYFDIFFDAWADKVFQEKSLFIEWAKDKHLKQTETYSSNIISDLPFKFVIAIVSKFVNTKLKSELLLDTIINENNISSAIKRELKSKLAEIYVFKLFFKIVKPKAIFVLSSFTKVGIVVAAKELGIKVYEAQHGYIGDAHTFYNAETQFKEAYPDYLLSFGTYEKQKASAKLIFNPEQIIPVGSFQLELIKAHTTPEELLNLKKSYRFVFCITLQAIKEEEMLGWLLKEAQLHKDWLFIIRAKNADLEYSKFTKQPNIIERNDFNIYEVLKISNYNITIYSTTAIEGSFLGAAPIFFNVNNLSKNHFDVVKMNAIVVEEGELLNEESLRKQANKEQSFFVANYLENVAKTNLCF